MYSSEAITRNVKFADNLLESGADAQALRSRHEQFLQEIHDDFWMRRDWAWSYTENSSFAVPAAQFVEWPVDFLEVGRDGGVFLTGSQLESRLAEVSPREIQFMRRSGRTESPPTKYASWDSDENGRPLIQLANGSATTLYLYYRFRPPLIVDKALACTAASGAAGVLTGAYNWGVTFYNADGETDMGFLSNQLVVSAKQVLLTSIPVSALTGITGRRIYRNATGSSVMKRVTDIADNTTTTFTDNVADGSLGAIHPTGVTIRTGLEIWPEPYVYRVIIPGMRYRAFEDKGDVRGEMWKQRYEEGLGWAAKTEVQSKSTVQRVAGFGMSHMY